MRNETSIKSKKGVNKYEPKLSNPNFKKGSRTWKLKPSNDDVNILTLPKIRKTQSLDSLHETSRIKTRVVRNQDPLVAVTYAASEDGPSDSDDDSVINQYKKYSDDAGIEPRVPDTKFEGKDLRLSVHLPKISYDSSGEDEDEFDSDGNIHIKVSDRKNVGARDKSTCNRNPNVDTDTTGKYIVNLPPVFRSKSIVQKAAQKIIGKKLKTTSLDTTTDAFNDILQATNAYQSKYMRKTIETSPLAIMRREHTLPKITGLTKKVMASNRFMQRIADRAVKRNASDLQLQSKRPISGLDDCVTSIELTSPRHGATRRLRGPRRDAAMDIRSRLRRASLSSPASSLNSHEQQEISARSKRARARFKWAIRMVTILLKWVSVMLQKKQSDEEEDNTYPKESGDKKMTTFTDLASDAYTVQPDDLNNSSLAFDPAYFKAKREVNISNEVKYILSLPPFARTQDQLQTALYGLQHLRSFAEYPLHMQEKLCKVAWFSQVPPKRVIIRQGHTAENFYFILSGQAVVSILEVNPKTKEPNMRTATVMRKGMSFGELALLHHSKRTATVVSQDFVQLLAVGRDDFFDIFMSGQGPGEIPEHVKFLKGVEFMKGWPIETLEEHPEQCLFHFFKRGVVVVRDSLNSEWIYVVKSGTCQVMKELKQVTGTVGLKKKITLAGLDSNLPQLGTCEQVPKIDNGRPHQRRNTCPIVPASALRSAITGFEDYMLEMQVANVPNSLPAINDEQSLVGSVEHKQPDHDGGKEKKVKFEDDKPIEKESLQAKDDKKVRSPTKSPIRLRAGSFNSVTSSSDATSRSSSPGESRSRAPIFVQVELLTSRDVFGLSNLFDIEDGLDIPKTSVSLISRGAECVMINKDFFMKHASDEIKRHLRGLINIYPEEETLQENLQIKADWDVYKKQLIRTMTENSPSSR